MRSTGLRNVRHGFKAAQDLGKALDAGHRFELLGHLYRHLQATREKVVDVGRIVPCGSRDLSDGEALGFDEWLNIDAAAGDLHGGLPSSSVVELHRCSSPTHEISSAQSHIDGMSRYKYRDAFSESYKALRETMTPEEIADALGKSTHMVTSYMRRGESGSIPPEDVIRKFAALCRVSPFRFMDDPRLAEAIGNEAYAALPQWQRDLLQLSARHMDGSRLSPEQWAVLVDRLGADARAMAALMDSASRKK